MYPAAQLFDLVADVERYPDFMPWVTQSRIRQRRDDTVFVAMTIAAGPIRKQFLSVGSLLRPHRIEITSDDPLFERFKQCWTFEPSGDGGTHVDYSVDFQFRSRALQKIAGAAFKDRASATLAAFIRRAHELYRDRPGLRSEEV